MNSYFDIAGMMREELADMEEELRETKEAIARNALERTEVEHAALKTWLLMEEALTRSIQSHKQEIEALKRQGEEMDRLNAHDDTPDTSLDAQKRP